MVYIWGPEGQHNKAEKVKKCSCKKHVARVLIEVYRQCVFIINTGHLYGM